MKASTKSLALTLLLMVLSASVAMTQGRGRGRGEGHPGRGHESSGQHDRREHDSRADRTHPRDYHRYDQPVVVHHHDHGYRRPVRWEPVHHGYSRVRYVYYRDYNCYFDSMRGLYVWYSGDRWIYSANMPHFLMRADLGGAVVMGVDYYDDDLGFYLNRRRPVFFSIRACW